MRRQGSRVASSTTVAILVSNFPPASGGGGPIRSTEAMVRLAAEPERVRIVSSCFDLGSGKRLPVPQDRWLTYHGARVWYADDRTLRGLVRGLSALSIEKPGVLYLNSLLSLRYSLVPVLLHRVVVLPHGVLVVAPRGELDPGALAVRPLRKRIYLRALRALGTHRHVVWHATNLDERRHIARHFPGARVLVSPPESLLPVRSEVLTVRRANPARMVFVGRVVPKKGLHVALEALRDVTTPVTLDVYGPGSSPEYVEECRRIARSLPGRHTVMFGGMLPHDQVQRVLAGAGALILPTAGENFGHVIAEALSVGCPVYAPPTTPWTPVLNGLGTLVGDRAVSTWTRCLERHAASGPAEHSALVAATRSAYDDWRRSHQVESFIGLLLDLPQDSTM